MVIESSDVNGFLLLRLGQDSLSPDELDELERTIIDYLQTGRRRIAVGLTPRIYPYSLLISVLVHCSQAAKDQDGVLSVIQPNPEFRALFADMRLDAIMSVVASEEELAGVEQ
jgi:anti-anti-sigma regulatory factor